MRLEANILASFRAGILAVDLGGTVSYVNDIAHKILKHFPVTIGESLRGRVLENDFFRMLVESLDLRYLPARVELSLPGREEGNRSIGFTLAELKEEGNRIGICAFFKDLTQVEMAEENRDLNERLRLLGLMAAGLAHEIRNPMASIGVHCGLLKSRYGDDPKLASSIGLMDQEIRRVEDIIRECLNFVRPAEVNIRATPVKRMLDAAILRNRKLFPGMEFVASLGGVADIETDADEGLMSQAVDNILANSAQACGEKGKVVVKAKMARGYWNHEVQGRDPMLSVEGEREDFLILSVKDDGPGIPEEIRDKIFVPFFTTRKDGTGIGLPLVQKIVYAHRGVLDVVSEEGKGTEFIVRIPLRQKSG